MDEDVNHHLNYRSYFNHAEECLMHFDGRIASNECVTFSMSMAYWRETAVEHHRWLFANICRKQTVFEKDRDGKRHIGWDLYGTLSVCTECCAPKAVPVAVEHKHDWVHHAGFVARVYHKKPLPEQSKL